MSKYYLVPLTGYYAGQYAVVGDSHYAIKTCKTFTEATRMMEQLEREDRETPHERKSADIPREVARKVHTWMDEEAFGSHVLLPIRTEKTAEQKWNELRRALINRQIQLNEIIRIAEVRGDKEMAARMVSKHLEVTSVLLDMDDMDSIDT